MTVEQFQQTLKEINIIRDNEIRFIKEKFIEENAEFKIGQYVGNVCGIIKIEKIYCDIFQGVPEISYIGEKYYKKKGALLKTKGNNKTTMRYNLKLIETFTI